MGDRDELGDLAARIAGEAVPKPLGPVVEELVRRILGVQDAQRQRLRDLQGQVAELRGDTTRLLYQNLNSGRAFLESAAIPGHPVKAKRRDLRRARDEFIRATAIHTEASLVRALIHSQLSLTHALLSEEAAARKHAHTAWRVAVQCLYREVQHVDATLSARKKGALVPNSPEIQHLIEIGYLIEEYRDGYIRIAPRTVEHASPRTRAAADRAIARGPRYGYRLQRTRSSLPGARYPRYSVILGTWVRVEQAYGVAFVRSRAVFVGAPARNAGLSGQVYLMSSVLGRRLCAGLIIPAEISEARATAFRIGVQRYFPYGIEVQSWPHGYLAQLDPVV